MLLRLKILLQCSVRPMPKIIVVLTGQDPETKITQLALYSENFKRTMDIEVPYERVVKMKTQSRYRFVDWSKLPDGHLDAEFVQTEPELLS